MSINIAIDGPTAAGKSTIAKYLANRLNYRHLDTGTMYRCVAYKALENGLKLDDEKSIVELMKTLDMNLNSDGTVYLDGEEVSLKLRKNEISIAASDVSKLFEVRKELVARQKEMAKSKGVIMDGRDIGTVVLPNAEIKIFLTASAEARAKRRFDENQQKGIAGDLKTLTEEIRHRDNQDMNREHSPLKKAEDAVELDTTDLTIEKVVERIEEIINTRV